MIRFLMLLGTIIYAIYDWVVWSEFITSFIFLLIVCYLLFQKKSKKRSEILIQPLKKSN